MFFAQVIALTTPPYRTREAQPLAVLLTTNCWRHCRFASKFGRLLLATHSLSFKHRGQKDSLSTHSPHRMAHTLKHFFSCSSIGTDTRCCSNGAGFIFKITFCRWIAAVGAGSASPKLRSVSSRPCWRDLKKIRVFSISYPLRVLPLKLKRESFSCFVCFNITIFRGFHKHR